MERISATSSKLPGVNLLASWVILTVAKHDLAVGHALALEKVHRRRGARGLGAHRGRRALRLLAAVRRPGGLETKLAIVAEAPHVQADELLG